ncbi:hypothetical protein [Archaeoglobus sp.]
MCAPISTTVGSLTSTSFATTLLFNQVLAVATLISIFGYKLVRIVKSL